MPTAAGRWCKNKDLRSNRFSLPTADYATDCSFAEGKCRKCRNLEEWNRLQAVGVRSSREHTSQAEACSTKPRDAKLGTIRAARLNRFRRGRFWGGVPPRPWNGRARAS